MPKGIGTCPRNNARFRISGALHPDIPYPVRDKLLNSLYQDFFNRFLKPDSGGGDP